MLPRHRLTLTAQIDHRLGLAKLSAKNKPFLCISWLPRAFCDSNRKRMSKNLLSLLLCLGLVSCYSLQSASWSLPFETECLSYTYSAMPWNCVTCYVFILQGLVAKEFLFRLRGDFQLVLLSNAETNQNYWRKVLFSLWGVHELWSLCYDFGYGLSPRFVITVKFWGDGTRRGGSHCLIFPLLWF